jgi:hypothetical protein
MVLALSALKVLQQQVCAVDDLMERDNLRRLISNEGGFKPSIDLGGNRPPVCFCRCRNLLSETWRYPQIELWIILRHGEQMTQKFTA